MSSGSIFFFQRMQEEPKFSYEGLSGLLRVQSMAPLFKLFNIMLIA